MDEKVMSLINLTIEKPTINSVPIEVLHVGSVFRRAEHVTDFTYLLLAAPGDYVDGIGSFQKFFAVNLTTKLIIGFNEGFMVVPALEANLEVKF